MGLNNYKPKIKEENEWNWKIIQADVNITLRVQWNFVSICFKLVSASVADSVTLGKSASWHEEINVMPVRIKDFAGKTSSSSLIYMQWAWLSCIFRGLKYTAHTALGQESNYCLLLILFVKDKGKLL